MNIRMMNRKRTDRYRVHVKRWDRNGSRVEVLDGSSVATSDIKD